MGGRVLRFLNAMLHFRQREAALLAQIGVLAAERSEAVSLRDQLQQLVDTMRSRQFVPPGHFYSAIPSLDDIAAAMKAMEHFAGPVQGIDMRAEQQFRLLQELAEFYPCLPFAAEPQAATLYHYDNQHYSYCDAILTFGMLNRLKPSRIVEIGSGYSTLLMADVNRICLGDGASQTAIDPYPGTLSSYQAALEGRVTVIPQPVQGIDLSVFEQLGPNDLLFVDSTHVSKTGSDVNRILFDVLPSLRPGVHVHIHDIFYPFEYPECWLTEGRSWNETYAVRAFLEFNSAFEVVLFSSMMQRLHRDWFEEHMPLCLKNLGGFIWLQKTS